MIILGNIKSKLFHKNWNIAPLHISSRSSCLQSSITLICMPKHNTENNSNIVKNVRMSEYLLYDTQEKIIMKRFKQHLMFMVLYILETYIFDSKSNKMHTDFLCILYYTTLALQVSGAIYTHHQEHKLQSTAVGMCDCYGVWTVHWSRLWLGVPATTCSNGLSNFQHTITITHTYGCTLQFVFLLMGVNSTRHM
jgi:hypothetical protein